MCPEAQIKTTVLIPVWDDYARDALERALRSLSEQQAPFELLIVNNASSTDLPSGIASRTITSASRVTLGAARNLGLTQVTTPYVIFWDADDEMLPGALIRLEQELDAEPTLVAFGMAIQEHPTGKRHRWPRRYLPVLARFPRLLSLVEPVWAQFPTTGATIIRADAAKDAGGFADADSGEDWCLGVSLAFRGRIGWSERRGRIYRLHQQSMWATHLTVAHQLQHARNIRQRLRSDPAVPGWLRSATPGIAVAQSAAIAVHTALAAVRRRLRQSD